MSVAAALERMRSQRWFALLARGPLLAFRLGLGPLVGRAFMVLTTTGRRTGRARHTMAFFHEIEGRKYVAGAYGQGSHWYRNLRADPRVTVQTARGRESMRARRVTDEGELARVVGLLARRPRGALYLASQGLASAPEDVVRDARRILLVALDPTGEPTPPGMPRDLVWMWPAALAVLAWLRTARARATGARPWRAGRRPGRCRGA
jgi:deazaflavin-dependent oxidoreductase (nitroreductase family)